MNLEPPIARVVSPLERSGYKTQAQEIAVGGIPFEFAAVLTGRDSLDLIVVVDTIAEADHNEVRRRVEGLSRALDLVKSRRPLTVVLVGPKPGIALTHVLTRVARVLVVGVVFGERAEEEIRNVLAVLLPLQVATAGKEAETGAWMEVREELLAAHPEPDLTALFEAAPSGADAVADVLQTILVAPFKGDGQ